MKTGFRIELSGDELSTIITACRIRQHELSENIDIARQCGNMKTEYLQKQYSDLRDTLRILENAKYFVEMGA